MADSRYSIYTATLAPVSPLSLIDFQSIDAHRWTPNATKAPYRPGGAVDKAFQGLSIAMPLHEFETCDLLTVLDEIDPLVGFNAGLGATFRRIKRKSNDVFEATTATDKHVLYSSSNGFACVKEITVRQDDPAGAKATVMYQPLSSDGLAVPETISLGAINGATAPAYVSRFFQGPVGIDSTKIESIDGFTVDFGKQFSAKLFNGYTFPVCGSIVSRDPSFKFTTAASNLNVTYRAFTNSDTIDLYLMKESATAANSRVPIGTQEHIKISATGEFSPDEDSVTTNDDASVSFTVDVVGTLSVSTSAEIPF